MYVSYLILPRFAFIIAERFVYNLIRTCTCTSTCTCKVGCGTISSLSLSSLSRCIAPAVEGKGEGKTSKQNVSQIKVLDVADRPGLYPDRYTDEFIPIRLPRSSW